MPATKETTYDEAQIAERLKALPGWYSRTAGSGGYYKTDGWPTTLMLVNAIGYLAEAAYHHPDLVGDVGAGDREAPDPQRRRHHRQGLRARAEDRGRRALAADGRRARGDAEQVGCGRRGSDGSCHAAAPRQRAVRHRPARRAGAAARAGRDGAAVRGDVAVMRITVAALMTTAWIARFLEVPRRHRPRADPGLVRRRHRGRCASARRARGEGPEGPARDSALLRPRRRPRASYGAWDIEILAEINNAPQLTRERFGPRRTTSARPAPTSSTSAARPGFPFPRSRDVVRELAAPGMRVSVDSFDPDEIRTAVEAGAELVLSVNGSNLEVARDLAGTGARVVVIPDFGGALDTLDRQLEALERWGVPYLIDPILEPIGFGFMASLERYAEVHRRYPDAAMLMGIGNITELTAPTRPASTRCCIAICQEIGVRAVLTTEVIPWARGAVREIDVARRLMHHAVTRSARCPRAWTTDWSR